MLMMYPAVVDAEEDFGLGTGADVVDEDGQFRDDDAATSAGGTQARSGFARLAGSRR